MEGVKREKDDLIFHVVLLTHQVPVLSPYRNHGFYMRAILALNELIVNDRKRKLVPKKNLTNSQGINGAL